MTTSMLLTFYARCLRCSALVLPLCGGLDLAAAPTITYYSLASGSEASHITLGPDGALWFTDLALGKIGRITTDGIVTSYSVPSANSQPMGIAAGPDGALWFTEWAGNKIGRIATNGAFSEYAIPTGSSQPSAITLGPDGALWFTEYSAGKVGRITTSGAITEYTNGQMLNLDGIVAGPDGALWVAEVGQVIDRVTTFGQITRFVVAGPGSPYPEGLLEGITVGPDGALWFTEVEYFLSPNIGRMTTSGSVAFYPLSATAVNSMSGITSGDGGSLWFAAGLSNIGQITTAGAVTFYPATATGDLTKAPDGSIFFTAGNQIGRLSFSCRERFWQRLRKRLRERFRSAETRSDVAEQFQLRRCRLVYERYCARNLPIPGAGNPSRRLASGGIGGFQQRRYSRSYMAER